MLKVGASKWLKRPTKDTGRILQMCGGTSENVNEKPQYNHTGLNLLHFRKFNPVLYFSCTRKKITFVVVVGPRISRIINVFFKVTEVVRQAAVAYTETWLFAALDAPTVS